MYRSQTYQAFHDGRPEEAMSAGCYPRPSNRHAVARRSLLQHVDESNCTADEVYCWMMCMSTENLTAITEGNCTVEDLFCGNLITTEP
eukprot:scaffold484721_cov51-Prasinocladus_malaysianus.AAC.1